MTDVVLLAGDEADLLEHDSRYEDVPCGRPRDAGSAPVAENHHAPLKNRLS